VSATVAKELLDELSALGVAAYRDGPELCLSPQDALTPELLARVQRHKDALLTAVLSLDAPPLAAKPPHGLGRCYECAAELPPGVEIARCFPCHKRHDPEARDLFPVVPLPPVST